MRKWLSGLVLEFAAFIGALGFAIAGWKVVGKQVQITLVEEVDRAEWRKP